MPQGQVEVARANASKPADQLNPPNIQAKKNALANNTAPRKQTQHSGGGRPRFGKQTGTSDEPKSTPGNSKLSTLKELFPAWSDEDLAMVLQETNHDVEVAIVRISEGRVNPFSQVSKGRKVAPVLPPVVQPPRNRAQGPKSAGKGPRSGQPGKSQATEKAGQPTNRDPGFVSNTSASKNSSTSGWTASEPTKESGAIKSTGEPNSKAIQGKVEETSATDNDLAGSHSVIRPDWSKIVGKPASTSKKVVEDKISPSETPDVPESKALPDIAFLSVEEKVAAEPSSLPIKVAGDSFKGSSETKLSSEPSNVNDFIATGSQANLPMVKGSNQSLIGTVAPPPGGLLPGNNNASIANLYGQPMQSNLGPNASATTSAFSAAFPPSPRYLNAQTMTDLYPMQGAAPNSFGYPVPPYAPGFYNPYFYPPHANPYAAAMQQQQQQYGSQQYPQSQSSTPSSSKFLSHYQTHSSGASPNSSIPFSPSSNTTSYGQNTQGKFINNGAGNAAHMAHTQQFYGSGQSYSPNGSNPQLPLGASGSQQFDSHVPLGHPYYNQPSMHASSNMQNIHPNFYSPLPMITNQSPYGHLPQQQQQQQQVIPSHSGQPMNASSTGATAQHRPLFIDKEGAVHPKSQNYWTMAQ